ncbi:MAG: endonuclease/exonuclease/phosphatase family protein [Candidatus Magasanikbacteria bacterium]|nr:endonuclease/exonuclease/phosphatase family protein [Candidatus Magasanikbacteria bacterium]
MKIISLNTYGGKIFEPLIDFIRVNADTIDIFCLQEMLDNNKNISENQGYRADLFKQVQKILNKHQGFFGLAQENFDQTLIKAPGINSGLAVFIKKDYSIKKSGEFFIFKELNSFDYKDFSTLPCNLQYLQLAVNNKLITVCNVHGTSEPGNKLDTNERLIQSKKIIDFITRENGEGIITGDFNLLPNTESIAMFEKVGLRNLIKEFSIKTTRGSLFKKLYPHYGVGPNGWQEFADYAFVSSGIKPVNFSVPDVPISDHLPLILEFEV